MFVFPQDNSTKLVTTEHGEAKEDSNLDLDAVQSLLAISRWAPPTPERSIASPDSGNSSISRNSSSASLISECGSTFSSKTDDSASFSDYGDKVS